MTSPQRLASLDQFRGYTVAGMFLVNFVGGFWACLPSWGHHNTYCSYADTIMPQFFFAVGFAFRLTFGRRVREGSPATAYLRMVRRLLGLVVVSLVIYTIGPMAANWQELVEKGWGGFLTTLGHGFKSTWFQTLLHIAATSLWILPVIRLAIAPRLLFMLVSAVLHIGLSAWFYFDWLHAAPQSIDGGPLGFLTWALPMLWGTIACDLMVPNKSATEPGGQAGGTSSPAWIKLALLSLLLMAGGWGLSCFSRMYDVRDDQPAASVGDARNAASPVLFPVGEFFQRPWSERLVEPPFVPPPASRALKQWELLEESGAPYRTWFLEPPAGRPSDESYRVRRWNYWMMSQRVGSASYHLFGAGLSGFLFVIFYGLCDKLGLTLGVFRTLGSNALAGYVLHMWVEDAVTPFIPKDAPGWYLMTGFAIFFLVTYLILRALEKQGIFIKV